MAVPKQPAPPVSAEEFARLLDQYCPDIQNAGTVAVGVSGGPDSMALVKLLSDHVSTYDAHHNAHKGPEIHALIVDHTLRPDSGEEAQRVKTWVEPWPQVSPVILTWAGEKPESRIQETARQIRYDLMSGYMETHHIHHLFLGHHQDDQAETFLFRLAKGSGLDGLSAMSPRHALTESMICLRPFLTLSKARLLAHCEAHRVPYLHDPSNKSEAYARVRLRKSFSVLEAEGLTSKRLSVTARRLLRAREALEAITKDTYGAALIKHDKKQISLRLNIVLDSPAEIGFRTILTAVKTLRPDELYAARLEKLETLFEDLIKPEPFRKRTLGGLVFVRHDDENMIAIAQEKQKS